MKLRLTVLLQIAVAIATFTSLSSCNQTAKTTYSMKGIWKMEGYGRLIDITDTSVNLYDTTKVSCLPQETLKLKDLSMLGKFEQVAQDTLMFSSGITEYRLTRISHLPSRCSIDEVRNQDPVYNFEVFYHTFKENYAYFKTRNINWDSLYQKKRPEVSKHTTPAKLHQLLSEMTSQIHDGHTAIALPEELQKASSTAEGEPSEPSSLKRVRDHVLYRNVAKPTITGRSIDGKGIINWGLMKDNIGYIQINSMICFLEFGIADSIVGGKYWEQYTSRVFKEPDAQAKEAAIAGKTIAKALYELRNTKGIILDLRFNGGGFDAVSLELLKHFVSGKTLMFNKQAWTEKGLTKKQMIFAEPVSPTYTHPVALLTSHSTASAAETFTLGTMSIRHFIRIGGKTEGIFSDALPKKLPNGWDFTMSNELFTSASGQNLENIGIAPDIHAGDADLKTLLVKDPAIDSALLELGKLSKSHAQFATPKLQDVVNYY
jgi:carboxyl-terminal processing protease